MFLMNGVLVVVCGLTILFNITLIEGQIKNKKEHKMSYSEWLLLSFREKQQIADQLGLTIEGAEEFFRQMSKEDE